MRAARKKPYIIHDEDAGKDITIWCQQVTRLRSKEYNDLLNTIHDAEEKKDAEGNVTRQADTDALMQSMARMIMLRVCDESKMEMGLLLDSGLGVEQYAEVIQDINALFARSEEEKKPGSQSMTTSSTSARVELDSSSRESLSQGSASISGSGTTLPGLQEPAN